MRTIPRRSPPSASARRQWHTRFSALWSARQPGAQCLGRLHVRGQRDGSSRAGSCGLSTNTLTDVFNYTMRDTAGATSSTTFTVTIHGANDAPVLAVQTGDQTATVGTSFSLLTLPAGTFTDVNCGDSLAYTATAADGTALPAWLTFDASTRTFSGTPTSTSAGTLSVKTSVTDFGGLSASETFNLAVTTAPSGVACSARRIRPADQSQ